MRTGAARGHIGNFHEAGFYSSDAEFLALIMPFVVGGMAAGEPVVIGYDARKCDLIRAVLPEHGGVTYIADNSLYASPARAIEAYRRQFERQLATGAEQIRIAGDVPHEGNGGRFQGWDRYESAVNAVWQDYPVWSRCLYDSATVPADVRDVVERTHRRLVTPDGHATASPRYQEVGRFESLPVTPDPLVATAPAITLVDTSPERTTLAVADVARGRTDAATFDEMMFALSEAAVNAQAHGRPPTTVTVWTTHDRIVAHVHDCGPGPADPLTGLVPVTGSSGGGLGLWTVHQLPNVDVALIADAAGFTVRLRGGPLPAPTVRSAETTSFPAGTPYGAPPLAGSVHVVDGDGSSFCDLVPADDLVRLGDLAWGDIPADQRCHWCRLLMADEVGWGPS